MLIETRRIPFNYIFHKIKNDVLTVLLFSASFQLIKFFLTEYLPHVPLQLPSILGISISLILAFNLNQSYDRWWEARKIWGAIVNDSRTLVLQLKGFINEEKFGDDNLVLKRCSYRQIAWCYCLGQSLRGLDAIAGLKKFIPEEEIDSISKHNNKPTALLLFHMLDLKLLYEKGAINSFQQIQIEGTLTRLCDSMGKAERIKNTVFPITYRLFIHFFIYIFLITLSLSLVEVIGVLEILFLTVLASTFFLLEKTAKHMQDPFENNPTDTSVTAIARTIEINIKQLLQDKEVPSPLAPEKFYIM